MYARLQQIIQITFIACPSLQSWESPGGLLSRSPKGTNGWFFHVPASKTSIWVTNIEREAHLFPWAGIVLYATSRLGCCWKGRGEEGVASSSRPKLFGQRTYFQLIRPSWRTDYHLGQIYRVQSAE